jgi:hypothetical protein
MRGSRLLAALLVPAVVTLAGCSGLPGVPSGAPSGAPTEAVPTIGPGTVVTDALTEAHCVRAADGTWSANGVVKNTTKVTRSFDVNIYIGPADGQAGVARVVTVKKLAAGKSAPWKAVAVQATAPAGPCYLRVRVAK